MAALKRPTLPDHDDPILMDVGVEATAAFFVVSDATKVLGATALLWKSSLPAATPSLFCIRL